MATGWTVEIATIGAAFADYGNPFDVNFLKRLNGLGYHNCLVPGVGSLPDPAQGQVIRYTWNKGLGSERIHFEGTIQDVRRTGNGKVFAIRGYDCLGNLWQGGQGGFRDYINRTPYDIAIQTPGPPLGLLYGAQGNLLMSYGTSAAVPNKITNIVTGTALDVFRADSSRPLLNFQRLCLQARFGAALAAPVPPNPPDPGTYGLEFFGKLEGANNSVPTLYLVGRRNRAAGYTAEEWNNPQDLVQCRRGLEGMSAAQVLKIIGAGDGQSRKESAVLGAGAIEAVISDKTVIDVTNADNMTNRLSNLLSLTTEVVTGRLYKHSYSTEVGDNVVVTETGVANTTHRVFELGYSLQHRCFFVTLGRPRPNPDSPLHELFATAESQAQAPQRVTARKVNAVLPATSGNIAVLANNVAATAGPLVFSLADYREFRDEAIEAWVNLQSDDPGDFDVYLDLVHNLGTFRAFQSRVELTAEPASSPGGPFRLRLPIHFTKGVLDELISGVNLTNVTSATLNAYNRTGADALNVKADLYMWILG